MAIALSNSKTTYLGSDPQGRPRFALDCSIPAIQFRENGGPWQDIDPSVEAPDTEGFSVKFTQVPYLGRIGDDSHRRIYPDRTDLSYWIQLEKPFASMPAPTRLDRWFYWDFPNALMGVRFDNMSIKFGFRLKNAAAPTSITIPFSTQEITRDGRLLKHNGQVVAELRAPIATDANGDTKACDISFGAGDVTISLDTTGLIFPIDIDPTLDLQVAAGSDDGDEREDTGTVDISRSWVFCISGTLPIQRFWGGYRWVSGGLPSLGATIDKCYAEVYVPSATYDDLNGFWHFHKAAAPPAWVGGVGTYDITSRPRTTAFTSDIVTGMGVGWHMTGGSDTSLVTPFQEVIDNFSPTAVALIFRPNTNLGRQTWFTSFDSNPALAAKFHVEWTESGSAPSESMGAKLIAGKLI